MNRKSRKVAFYIPEKSELYGSAGQPDLPSLDVFFYSDAPAIHFYRNPQTRGAVKDFFVSLAGSEQVALSAMYYSDKHNLPFTLVFSLMHTESRFLPDAVNQNATSIDRGVFQLNNLAFPHLNEHDFFDPDLNASYGVSHLEWCLSVSSSLDEALAIYNAGYGKVKRGDIPASTIRYIAKIHEYRRTLEEEFYRYLVAEIPHRVLNLAAVPAASHTP
ncbi:lytic transglycosylase domain-containing protein [Salinispira pacifica]|uniref:Transglycosylase SLT domain-containing protein n=1 Tax=Salinispira pacifica TaxID=1307761 RepID=V5WLW7_9SPIO|nr:lytic transglycosylase domain-containing protein [Salinispira pacifica]AHC16600.1 hypothetical protein L21SP2_3260 [Salinispira pacifica]